MLLEIHWEDFFLESKKKHSSFLHLNFLNPSVLWHLHFLASKFSPGPRCPPSCVAHLPPPSRLVHSSEKLPPKLCRAGLGTVTIENRIYTFWETSRMKLTPLVDGWIWYTSNRLFTLEIKSTDINHLKDLIKKLQHQPLEPGFLDVKQCQCLNRPNLHLLSIAGFIQLKG